MTTGDKIATLRKKKNLTQEQLAEMLNVSRQSVSRWEMDVAFPETEKLIKLGKILECSIDFLLGDGNLVDKSVEAGISVEDCFRFIRECGYFFLATIAEDRPRLRPMGMIYADGKYLYLATDTRKGVYQEMMNNPRVEVGAYSLNSRKWLRLEGSVEPEHTVSVVEGFTDLYPMLKQEYAGEEALYLTIFRIQIDKVSFS